MDKLEYIPGDLVNWWATEKPMRLDGVYYKKKKDKVYYTREEENNNTMLYSDEDIEPITLTSAILEKNGWYGATHSKQSDDNTKILYKTFKRKGYPTIKVSQDLKITCELSPFIVKLESVSDLQHILFGLNINHEMEV